MRECLNLKEKKAVDPLQALIQAVRRDDMQALKAIGAVPSLDDLLELVENCRSAKAMQQEVEESFQKLNGPIAG